MGLAVTRVAAAVIDFHVLGPVEAVREGEALRLGGTRQRTLLALLLLERGRAVSPDRLAEGLWQGKPPAGASTTLPTYVSRLRGALGGDGLLHGDTAGYRLDVPAEHIDAERFERLVREGEEALARGRP